MLRIAQALRDRAEELATLESRDNGKPLRQARTDVQVAARYFEFFAGIADKIMGNTIPLGPGFLDFTVREPIGVSAQIVPWNYPIQIGARGVAPALAAGCTVVLKPSSEAPMTALRLGEIALDVRPAAGRAQRRARHGRGGRRRAGEPSRTSISSRSPARSSVGIAVAKMAADNVVPVVMELGGKSPNIVFADADLDLAVAGRGERDLSERRPDLLGRIAAAGRAQGARRARRAARRRARKAMRVGPGVSDPDMGPIISKRQLETVERYVKIGRRRRRDGRRRRQRGRRIRRSVDGYYFQPTLLDQVSRRTCASRRKRSSARCSRSSTFDDVEEAVAIANRSQYGLVAGIWTRDINKAMALASRIKSGQVFINTYGAGGGVELPFGGYKKSGYGREKGLESLASYTQVKNVCIKFA